jgi:DNA polymerase-4
VASAAPVIAQRGLTLVGFAVSGIDRSGAQQLMLSFGEGGPLASDAIETAIDRVRRRYGRSALTPAVLIGRDAGLEMPHLPD